MLTKISKLTSKDEKLSCYCTLRYKMESIHTKNRMKGQGSHEFYKAFYKHSIEKYSAEDHDCNS